MLCQMPGSQKRQEISSPLICSRVPFEVVAPDLCQFAALDHPPLLTKKTRHVILGAAVVGLVVVH
jgi:hypothetical protein